MGPLSSAKSLGSRKVWLMAAAFGLLLGSTAHAQTVTLPPGGSFKAKKNGQTFLCGKISGKWIPGTLSKNGGFLSYVSQIKALKQDLRKAATAKAKAKIQAKITSAGAKKIAGTAACKSGPPATGTPTPGGGGGSPTPTPTPSNQCITNGVARAGCFGLPVSGNVNAGASAWSSKSCAGCHSEASKQKMSFSRVTGSFSSVPTMRGLAPLSTTDAANITAYLNRFN